MWQNKTRLDILLLGVVQGIGLRPKLYQLALAYNLTGHCRNKENCVHLLWQGSEVNLNKALKQLKTFLEPFAEPVLHVQPVSCVKDEAQFSILPSVGEGLPDFLIAPDLATCSACLAECHDPQHRRFGYAFNSCAQCGPRYSLSDALPFDRSTTSMQAFTLCNDCQEEYNDPLNRRFHAQLISCETCGPTLWLGDKHSPHSFSQAQALKKAIQLLNQGKILAIKGLGGYHLMALATHHQAVSRLRHIKHRPHKPFALMVRDVEQAQKLCLLSSLEVDTLNAHTAPIVIAQKHIEAKRLVCDETAPQQDTLGIMLAYTPLHHLLLEDLKSPLVITSANRKGEPIIYQDASMFEALQDLADYCLWHNREIINPVEDSVVRMIDRKMRTLRLARGLVPFKTRSQPTSQTYISLGAHQKNHVGCWLNDSIVLSPTFGDLHAQSSVARHQAYLNHRLAQNPSAQLIQDHHPGYATHQEPSDNSTWKVYHHLAHVFSVIEEHQVAFPILGFAWDGFGLGPNNQWWGAEAFKINDKGCSHTATIKPIPMIGGEQAFKEPRRVALAILHTLIEDNYLDEYPNDIQTMFDAQTLNVFKRMLKQKINVPLCSSMGRLFDGVAALLGGPKNISFEGQAAMALEQMAVQNDRPPLPLVFIQHEAMLLLDWRPMIMSLLKQLNTDNTSRLAFDFHLWCAQAVLKIAQRNKVRQIVLSGGVFQNKLLTELCCAYLRKVGFKVFLNEKVPMHDGGLALGQLALVKYEQNNKQSEKLCV